MNPVGNFGDICPDLLASHPVDSKLDAPCMVGRAEIDPSKIVVHRKNGLPIAFHGSWFSCSAIHEPGSSVPRLQLDLFVQPRRINLTWGELVYDPCASWVLVRRQFDLGCTDLEDLEMQHVQVILFPKYQDLLEWISSKIEVNSPEGRLLRQALEERGLCVEMELEFSRGMKP